MDRDEFRQVMDAALTQHMQAQADVQARAEGWRGWRLTHHSTWLSAPTATGCTRPLQVTALPPERSVTERQRLVVRCPDTPGWEAIASVQANVYAQAVTVSADVERRQVLVAHQLGFSEVNIAKTPRGFFSNVQAVVGLSARRRLRAGQVLSANVLEQTLLVRKGQRVTLQATQSVIQAHVDAQALEDGRQGERIKVRNLASGKVLDGWVTAAGRVRTGM